MLEDDTVDIVRKRSRPIAADASAMTDCSHSSNARQTNDAPI